MLRELQKCLPHEQLIYLGDTARLPYGTKSQETIIRYTMQNCSFLATSPGCPDVKLIIIACNSATSAALETAASYSGVPVIGVIDPVIEQVAQTTRSGKIGILGTRATVNSGVYEQKIRTHLPEATLTAVAAPVLISLVEEGFINHPMTHLAIEEYVRPLLQAQVDTVILACTHFPLLQPSIEKALGPSIQVINPAFRAARATLKTLQDLNLLSPSQTTPPPLFYVTDDPDKFKLLGPQFLNHPIENVHCVELH